MAHINYELTSDVPERTYENNKNYFFSLCRSGNVSELMEFMPFIGTNVSLLHEYDHRGRMCTHIVARYDQKNTLIKIEILFNWGADLNAGKAKTGDTLLHIATIKKNYQLADWLCRETRFNNDAINFAHQTPYHLAYFSRDQRMINIFKTNGADSDDPIDSDSFVDF